MQDVLLVLAEVPLFNARSSDAFLRARAETLAYTYSSGTNKLSKVTVGGVQKSYAYNADGTMKTDGLRGQHRFGRSFGRDYPTHLLLLD